MTEAVTQPPGRIVVLDPITEATAARLRALLPTDLVLAHATARGDDHLKQVIAGADYAISGQVAVSAGVLEAAPGLRLLHKWGVGVDNLDLDAARRLGIKVARTTGSNAVPVAELALGLMISTLRNMTHAAHELHGGRWVGGNYARPAFLLSGKTVGIVGFGAIGQTVARLLAGFGCPVLYSKPTPVDAETETRLRARHVPLAQLLAEADVVTLHCPLTPATAGLIDRAALRSMKRTAILVNLARGGVVNEDDLVWALRERVIHGAAMDVFATEPLPPDSPLVGLEGATLTPHIAASAAETFDATVRQMFGNIARVSRGEAVPERDAVVP